MELRSAGTPSGGTSHPPSEGRDARAKSSRHVWVVTAYAISGLVLFGILAYYFSSYIAR